MSRGKLRKTLPEPPCQKDSIRPLSCRSCRPRRRSGPRKCGDRVAPQIEAEAQIVPRRLRREAGGGRLELVRSCRGGCAGKRAAAGWSSSDRAAAVAQGSGRWPVGARALVALVERLKGGEAGEGCPRAQLLGALAGALTDVEALAGAITGGLVVGGGRGQRARVRGLEGNVHLVVGHGGEVHLDRLPRAPLSQPSELRPPRRGPRRSGRCLYRRRRRQQRFHAPRTRSACGRELELELAVKRWTGSVVVGVGVAVAVAVVVVVGVHLRAAP
mmetsp:Transcript_23064/g.53321  ORF Transcript_23064/g.53321 Transcript_23064/m.53321 type:complete len:272 (-) Transcript_23064:1272-2087(-)